MISGAGIQRCKKLLNEFEMRFQSTQCGLTLRKSQLSASYMHYCFKWLLCNVITQGKYGVLLTWQNSSYMQTSSIHVSCIEDHGNLKQPHADALCFVKMDFMALITAVEVVDCNFMTSGKQKNLPATSRLCWFSNLNKSVSLPLAINTLARELVSMALLVFLLSAVVWHLDHLSYLSGQGRRKVNKINSAH